MAKNRVPRTNVLRLLDAAGIEYEAREYPVDESDLSGVHAAELLGIPAERVFKTLVLRGAGGAYYVCCIPVAAELDLKKAACLAGEKSIGLLPLRELQSVTGYVRGGCSPIGMKKVFPTFIDETAELFDRIAVSAGLRGLQLILAPGDLLAFTGAALGDLATG
jgi:Cys-tRNA(Pro)/Cys-tRNA(Cys) deacylase